MEKKKISFALQGGGSHGAFTWGIMEKLLEEDVLDINGFCGTSAGAVNATVIAYGMQQNGAKGAIDLMEKFWKEVSLASTFLLPQPNWMDNNMFYGNMDFSPYYKSFSYMTNHLSPYQFNPLNINPLKSILEKFIDFTELKESKIKLFIAATKVSTGSLKVFSLPEISLEAVLASACLPLIFRAVEINGEDYWDGGYSGNPPIYPLIYGTDAKDILLIQIHPMHAKPTPKDVSEIADRINEISFNTSLMAEMRMITRGYDIGGEIKNVHFQLIPADALYGLNFSSKLNTSWEFLNHLRKMGRDAATEWLATDLSFVGKESCPLIKQMFGYDEESWLHEMIVKPAAHLKKSGNTKQVVK